MIYFKDSVGTIFAYETQEEKELFGPADLVPALSQEVPVTPLPNHNASFSPVTPRQIRQALTAMGLREQVEVLISAGPQDLKDWWEFSENFEIDHPTVLSVAQALNVGQSTLIQLFQLATSL